MITAEEFLKSKGCEFNTYDIGKCFDGVEIKDVIEFTKLHIEAAKKEYHKVLVKQGIVTDAGIGYFDNVYSLDNIK